MEEDYQGGGAFSHKATTLSTDLRCYFNCPQGFKKDYDLRLHIKLRHANESEAELRNAYQAAEEEIALTSRNASTYKCALCTMSYRDHGGFYGHIRKSHNMQWQDYKDTYGRCEVESAPFECKICGRVVKYARNTVHVHLKNVHRITWPKYLERIRAMRQGRPPEELPNIEFFQCKVCTSSVKFLFRAKHLKGVHKITESEYTELFKDDLAKDTFDQKPSIQPSIPMMDQNNNYEGGFDNSLDMKPTFPQIPLNDNDRVLDNSFDMKPNVQQMNSNIERSPVDNFRHPEPVSNEPMAREEEERRPPKPPKSDIQDKTNKNCSSCSQSFPTRRNFIEHCTTTHNMKFRTQSGATISAGGPSPSPFGQAQLPQY